MKYSTSRNQTRYKVRKFFRQLTPEDIKKVGNIAIGVIGWIAFIFAAAIISALV